MPTFMRIVVVIVVSIGLAACGSGRKGSSSRGGSGNQFRDAANMNASQEKFYKRWVAINIAHNASKKCKFYDAEPAKKKEFQDLMYRLDGHARKVFTSKQQSRMAFVAMGQESSVGYRARCGNPRAREVSNLSYDTATQWVRELDGKK